MQPQHQTLPPLNADIAAPCPRPLVARYAYVEPRGELERKLLNFADGRGGLGDDDAVTSAVKYFSRAATKVTC